MQPLCMPSATGLAPPPPSCRRGASRAWPPPRRSCASALAPLPLLLALRIFVSLPVDSRGRACCVCRAWRDALADPALWTHLDLSEESGVPEALDADALLRGAAARADGRLYHLDVSWPRRYPERVLLEVLAANAGSLRELHAAELDADRGAPLLYANLAAITAAAPLLQVLHFNYLYCPWETAVHVMRREPPWALLRFSALSVDFADAEDVPGGIECVAPFAAGLVDAALHPELPNLILWRADTQRPEVMDALVDAALARPLRKLTLEDCTPPAAAPLARLLAGGALAELDIAGDPGGGAPQFDAAGAALVADALRATATLTTLELRTAGLCRDMRVADALLGALVGHRSLRVLTLEYERPADARALGAALAALVAANAPALQELRIGWNALGDVGLAPIVDALPRNCRLRVLRMAGNNMSEAFARERLLPAVRANTGLQELACSADGEAGPAAEAEELVQRRPQRS